MNNFSLLSVLVATIVVANSASYADSKTDIARCAAISDGVKRLDCFDQIASSMGVDKPITKTETIGKWRVDSNQSPIDDSKNVILMLDAETEFKGWMKSIQGTLILRCKENKTDAYVTTGMAAQPEYGLTDSATATIRYDKEGAQEMEMNESTDNSALFFNSAVSEIKKMMAHHEMLFRFTPFNAPPTLTTFKLDGLEDAIKPLRKACGW